MNGKITIIMIVLVVSYRKKFLYCKNLFTFMANLNLTLNQTSMKNLLSVIFIAGIIASCNMPNKNMANEKAAKDEAGMQAFYDQVMNAHNVAMLDSFCTSDFVDHNPGDPQFTGKGMDDLKKHFTGLMAAFPDMHLKTNFMSAHGDTVTAFVTMSGTNSGPMMGMPATNKSFSMDGIDVMVIKDGKATDRWGFFDDMKMMKDLGMMPEPGAHNMAEEGKMEKAGKKMDEKMEKMGMEKKK